MSFEKVEKAAVGDRVILPREDTEREVYKSCGQNGHGQWVCLNHKQVFDNGFQKDSHICNKGYHLMAWFCHECGRLEVP